MTREVPHSGAASHAPFSLLEVKRILQMLFSTCQKQCPGKLFSLFCRLQNCSQVVRWHNRLGRRRRRRRSPAGCKSRRRRPPPPSSSLVSIIGVESTTDGRTVEAVSNLPPSPSVAPQTFFQRRRRREAAKISSKSLFPARKREREVAISP